MTFVAGNLLIVDDDPSVRRAFKRLLRKEDYAIHDASSAEDAKRILSTTAIDVIVCDQDMPGTTGIEFLSDIASKYPDQRRLMLSGRFQSREVASAMDVGAIHKFMMKPWDDAILKADIRASFRQIMTSYNAQTRGVRARTQVNQNTRLTEQQRSWADYAQERILSRELHSAASDGSLSLVYQPQICLHEDTVNGFEALLRWRAKSGPVGAARFIELAERNGSISALTRWVVREACHQVNQWCDRWHDARVALNVSPVDLHDDKLVDFIESTFSRYAISPNLLQIEVTESQALNCNDAMFQRLTRLAEMGSSLAIDDFGAGATALSYIADLPFSTLKLDRSLTRQITSPKGQTVIQKVLEMARCLNMKTTMEGIETEEEANLARSLGADTAQGYFYSKPRPLSDVQHWLDTGRGGSLT